MAVDASRLAPTVELLHTAPSVVVVSSSVKNQTDRPEGLVDGRPETAWNSRPGDLAGAWIAFRVPEGTRIKAIKMTSGFTRTKGEHDLFTMNHRVLRVRVRRGASVFGAPSERDGSTDDASVLLERALDPERRDLQTLEVDLPGGDYVVDVLATKPGTKAAWREVAVSEFQVWGTLPRGRVPVPQVPQVWVGALRGLSMNALDGPFADLATYCAAFLASVVPEGGVEPIAPACVPGEPQRFEPGHGIEEAVRIRINDGSDYTEERVALRTDRGWYVALLRQFGGAHPGCGGKFFEQNLREVTLGLEGEGERLFVGRSVVETASGVELTEEEALELGYGSFRMKSTEATAIVCGVSPSGQPACSTEVHSVHRTTSEPADPNVPDVDMEVRLDVLSKDTIEVKTVRGAPAFEPGRYALNY